MAEQLEILGLPQSNYVWATRIAPAYKGVDHVHHTFEPHSPEILKISPLGKIPAMRHRDVTLFESWLAHGIRQQANRAPNERRSDDP